MASCTKVYKVRKRLKQRKSGRDRKHQLERNGSTPSKAAFFGEAKPEARTTH